MKIANTAGTTNPAVLSSKADPHGERERRPTGTFFLHTPGYYSIESMVPHGGRGASQ